MPRPAAILCLVLLLAATVAGCGRPSGPRRYRVSGTVRCDGRPIPVGEILFTPDGTHGHRGPQGLATIRDGRFDTAGSRAPDPEPAG